MIHMWAFLDLPDKERIYWRDLEVPRDKVFSMVKMTARLNDSELIMFDGHIYRYDAGQGKFIRTEWDSLDWECYDGMVQ